jgi:hypothetical protein
MRCSAIFPPTWRIQGSSVEDFTACPMASSSDCVIDDMPFSFRQTVE